MATDTAPNHRGEWVSDEVNMSVIAGPEVDCATEKWPVTTSRIVRVSRSQSGVGHPHDILRFLLFIEESGQVLVDLFGVGKHWTSSSVSQGW
jgi:hypothetical protein